MSEPSQRLLEIEYIPLIQHIKLIHVPGALPTVHLLQKPIQFCSVHKLNTPVHGAVLLCIIRDQRPYFAIAADLEASPWQSEIVN